MDSSLGTVINTLGTAGGRIVTLQRPLRISPVYKNTYSREASEKLSIMVGKWNVKANQLDPIQIARYPVATMPMHHNQALWAMHSSAIICI